MIKSVSFIRLTIGLILLGAFTISAKKAPISNDIVSAARPQVDTTVVPDFTMTDINDKPLTLSSFRGKSYVILDFWASWCGPCRAFTHHLKGIYSQYHDKGLEVISVSSDYTLNDWVNGVLNDGMTKWYNIYPPAHKGYKNFNHDWGIPGVPTVILIDKEGKAVARYFGTDNKGNIPELNQKLADIFK